VRLSDGRDLSSTVTATPNPTYSAAVEHECEHPVEHPVTFVLS
jgi:hypothetical protein